MNSIKILILLRAAAATILVLLAIPAAAVLVVVGMILADALQIDLNGHPR